jgi:tRNA A37 threonylcarbamoyladenosine synthetase subunit TsaC/SUA5/YrdC
MKSISTFKPSILSISQAVNYLKQPQAVICIQLDDRFYLAARAYDLASVEKINQLKNRQEGRPLVLAFANLKDALNAQLNSPLLALLPKFKGLLTVSVPSPPALPTPAHRGTGMIGVRLLDQAFANQILDLLEEPLVLSSANPIGMPAAKTIDELGTYQWGGLPLVVDPNASNLPTKEIKVTVITWVNSSLKLLAEGDLSLEHIQSQWDQLRR